MTVSRRHLLHLALGSATSLIAGNRRALAGSSASSDRLHWQATADSGSGDRHQFANGRAMAALHRRDPVDLVIMAGDNIYDNGDMREVAAKFERPYQELLKA
ncbi:MAG: metallophosphoesterase, partial [Cyanobium sp.]